MSRLPHRLQHLLDWEVAYIQQWLDQFEVSATGRSRRAVLGESGQYIVVEAFPLPDGYQPDEVDVLIVVDNHPTIPPIGLYVLNRGNERLVSQLRGRFNAFEGRAFHDAPSIPNYTWCCYAYAENRWRYNAAAPHKGDNVRKFLAGFHAELEGASC